MMPGGWGSQWGGLSYIKSSVFVVTGLPRENVLSDCQVLNMRSVEHLISNNTRWIGITFDEAVEKENLSVVIQLQGETLNPRRHIKTHKFYHSGDTIDQFSSGYIVKMKKNINVEEDPGNTCRNYPNKDFASYKDCDDKNMADTFKDIVDGLNITPPWLTDNLDSVTVMPVELPAWDPDTLRRKRSMEKICILFTSRIETHLFSSDPDFVLWRWLCQLPSSVHYNPNRNQICEKSIRSVSLWS